MIIDKVNSNILKLTTESNLTVTQVKSIKLLKKNRFDVVIKFIYGTNYLRNTMSPFIEKLYCDHIRCINGFVENDCSNKIGKVAFLNSFHELLDNVRDSGFKNDEIIPIGNDMIILDGAHRLSTQIQTENTVNIVNIDYPGVTLDYKFFQERGLSQEQLDFSAIEYAKLDKQSHMIILWPLANGVEDDLISIFEEYGDIVYRKETNFNLSGLTQLVRVAYSRESWLGSERNDFVGARNKARWCFSEKNKLRAFLFHAYEGSDLIKMKEKIRKLFSQGKHPIHINDTHEETIELAKFIFNKNTVSWANKSRIISYNNFEKLHDEFKKSIVDNNLILDDFIVVGSTLSAFGVKDCNDFDYINLFGLEVPISDVSSAIEYERSKLNYLNIDVKSLINDPVNYYYYNNVKFLSLNNMIKLKNARGRDNDNNDLIILNKLQKSHESYDLSIFESIQMISKVSFWKARVKMLLLKVRYYIFKVLK